MRCVSDSGRTTWTSLWQALRGYTGQGRMDRGARPPIRGKCLTCVPGEGPGHVPGTSTNQHAAGHRAGMDQGSNICSAPDLDGSLRRAQQWSCHVQALLHTLFFCCCSLDPWWDTGKKSSRQIHSEGIVGTVVIERKAVGWGEQGGGSQGNVGRVKAGPVCLGR